MRWDDLVLLRLIDELEQTQQMGHLQSGLQLLMRAADGAPVDQSREALPFTRELILAATAGFLTWSDQSQRSVGGVDPFTNSHYWLQQIWDLRLTIAGRDRARGRVIQTPLPDPEADDDRPITGMTLEEIARAIGDTYTASQLPRYLRDSGIPEEYLPAAVPENKWSYVFEVLEGLHDGGSASRRVLRQFLGGWLEGRYHTAPRDEIRERIAILLAQQGWHVRDGRLVIGERTHDAAGNLTPLGRDVRLAALHADVRRCAERYIESGHVEVGIFEAFKAVNNRVKQMTKLDLDGSALMGKAFSDIDPVIELADLSTETGRKIQSGFRFLFMGATQGIRNPDAHEQFKPLDDEEGFEALAFASLLMRRLDEANVKIS
jgi:uncharacterized protein (TIGR02391 family)